MRRTKAELTEDDAAHMRRVDRARVDGWLHRSHLAYSAELERTG